MVGRIELGQATALVTFLLDRSESMGAIKDATIEAFNGYLKGLKQDPAGILFTMLQFDTISIDKLYVAEPVLNVNELTHRTFEPRSSTPLIDAAVKTIRAVERSLSERKDNPKVIVCFQTDGQENSSREHTWAELNDLVKEKTLAGWQFVFLGVGIDAYQQAQMMGISAGSTVSTTFDPQQMDAAYGAAASNTMDFARGRSRTTHFTAKQRAAAGDRHYPGPKLPPLSPRVPTVKSTARPAAKKIVDDIDLG